MQEVLGHNGRWGGMYSNGMENAIQKGKGLLFLLLCILLLAVMLIVVPGSA